MKKIIRTFACALALATCTSPALAAPKVQVFDTDSLTAEILENRTKDDAIIEVVVGECINRSRDGKVLTTIDTSHNYISYRGVDDAHKGDIILSVFVYSTENNYVDDISERYDFIIGRPEVETK